MCKEAARIQVERRVSRYDWRMEHSSGRPRKPTLDEILTLQLEITQWTGGEAGVMDFGKLETVLDDFEVSGGDTVLKQAAHLLRGLALNRCFRDANKRVAFAAAVVMLRDSGYRLSVSDREAERYILDGVIRGGATEADVAEWLGAHLVGSAA